MERFIISTLIALLGAAAIVSLAAAIPLMLAVPIPWRSLNFDAYSAIGELLLVFVLSIEGGVAFFEIARHQRTARTAANAAVFELHRMYLSTDYQRNVRRPAWYSLSRARIRFKLPT